ncbi:MAG TPA: hypothetical protein VKZ63_12000 [Kofleriaceae bacterium]|nr:hypothetical protein [Kofleriaceae bacterium]
MLLDPLRRAPDAATAESFQLMGEDLVLVTGRDLLAAAERYADELGRVPAPLRERFEAEQRALAAEAHTWLRRYNRSVHTRLAGYLALGFRARFAYPWPVVAMLGICQVMGGFVRSRLYGLVGAAAGRLRYARLEELAEATDDVLRRTNRGIFADSVPTVLYALRAAELSAGGDPLGRALLDGPLPPLFDEETRALADALVAGLAERDPARRFRALSALTRRHFAREQAIFTHHMGGARGGATPPPVRGWLARMTGLRELPAPAVVRTRRGPRVEFRPYLLPVGFDMRDHDARVRELARAFVDPVTGSIDDYLTAVAYVARRFDRRRRPLATAYDGALSRRTPPTG